MNGEETKQGERAGVTKKPSSISASQKEKENPYCQASHVEEETPQAKSETILVEE